MQKRKTPELPIIQKTYDLILWFVPLLNKLPRDYKYTLGDRITNKLLDLLDELHIARYEKDKLVRLRALNGLLDQVRYQIRLLKDLKIWEAERYAHAAKLINGIGSDLGGWIKQQQAATP